MLKEIIREIAEIQRKDAANLDPGTKSDILDSIDTDSPLAVIISGARRSSKSTLLKQIMRKTDNFCYFNFEDERAINFEVSDFNKLDKVFEDMNPKKAYAIDQGLARANSVSFSRDKGRILDNIVFLHLRRRHRNIFYFRERHECDFIVKDRAYFIRIWL